MIIKKAMTNNTYNTYIVQELHTFFIITYSSIIDHFISINIFTTFFNLSSSFFLHSQLFQSNSKNFQSKYCLMSCSLSHSHSQILGFQMNPLSHIPLSINSLGSHLHLSLFQHCLLLQTLAPNLHLHLDVSCYFISCFIISRLNTLTFILLTTSGTHNFAYRSLILL